LVKFTRTKNGANFLGHPVEFNSLPIHNVTMNAGVLVKWHTRFWN